MCKQERKSLNILKMKNTAISLSIKAAYEPYLFLNYFLIERCEKYVDHGNINFTCNFGTKAKLGWNNNLPTCKDGAKETGSPLL